MARTNAKVTNCFTTAISVSDKEAKRLAELADQYNSGDITADYVSAVQDRITQETKLLDQLKAQLTPESNPSSGVPTTDVESSREEIGNAAPTYKEQAAAAWDEHAATIPDAPKFADLPKATRSAWYSYGEKNWTRADMVAELQKSQPAQDTTRKTKSGESQSMSEGIKEDYAGDVTEGEIPGGGFGESQRITDVQGFIEANEGVQTAVDALRQNGLEHLWSRVGSIHLADAEALDADAGLHQDLRTGEIQLWIDRDFINAGPEAQKALAFNILHELGGHLSDGAYGRGAGKSTNMKAWEVKRVGNQIVPVGSVAKELFKLYNSGNQAARRIFAYPFENGRVLDDQGKPHTDARLTEELYAQAAALHLSLPERFKELAPLASYAIKGNLNAEATTKSQAGQARRIVASNPTGTRSGNGISNSGTQGASQNTLRKATEIGAIEHQVTLSADELKYFSSVFGNEDDLEDLHDTVPSARLEGNVLSYDASERGALQDYVAMTNGYAAKSRGGEGAGSLPKSFGYAGAKFAEKLRGAADAAGNTRFTKQTDKFADPTSGLNPAPAAPKVDTKLPPALRGPLQSMYHTLADFVKKGVFGFAFTSDLADMASNTLPSLKQYMRWMNEKAATKGAAEQRIEDILHSFSKLTDAERGTGPNSVNAFIKESTESGKWGYGEFADADMKTKFDALPSDSARDVVKRIFEHGSETLKLKQNLIRKMADDQYSALIAAEKDPEAKAKLEKERDASLAAFKGILEPTDAKPYAPLKRFGPYAVVARSAEFEAAMEEGNSKFIEANQTDPRHNVVSFFETMGQAKTAEEQLRAQGLNAHAFERDAGRDYIQGGVPMLRALGKLRELVNEDLDESVGKKANAAMNRMISDLYLGALAETSARQSENRRKNIAGADTDMLRAFATQGRADAHFIAAMQHGDAVESALMQMRKEAKDTKTDGKDARMRIYNEIVTRHAMGMDAQPSRATEAMLRASSLWMLATSPAYYLTNATQPMVISLPYMAGKFGYNVAFSAMTKAYGSLAPMLKSAKLGESLDLTKVPADVKLAVDSLIKSGAIDIGMSHDLGSFESLSDSKMGAAWNKVDRGMRTMQNKVEIINRLSTAIAAYRLHMSKTDANHAEALQYAEKVVTLTHGDYSGINAPRYFRSPVARVLSQFKKFQIIQIGLMARLFHNSFANGPEKDIARAQLGFMLGHMAVLGGAMGLPGAAMIGAVFSALFGDPDEPDDAEFKLRRAIGNEQMADLLIKGVPAMMGMDISGRVGMGTILSPLPFAEMPKDRTTTEKAIVALSGPFIGGLLPKAADGISMIHRGDYYKGLEQLAPNGLANAMKAYRFSTDGVTKQSTGDVQLKPEDVSFMAAFSQAMGLPAGNIADAQTDRRFVSEVDAKFRDRSNAIQYQFNRAVKEGDVEARAQAMQAFQNLQAKRRELGYPVQPLSQLLKGPQDQAKRERNTLNGVAFNKYTKNLVTDLQQ